jgi:hypothetical protein
MLLCQMPGYLQIMHASMELASALRGGNTPGGVSGAAAGAEGGEDELHASG